MSNESQAIEQLGPIVEPVDQFFCPQCKRPLHSSCVVGKNVEHPRTGKTVRWIRVLCDGGADGSEGGGCGGFQCFCGIGGGYLRPLAPPAKITNAAELTSLRRIVDHNRFVIQTKKSA